MRRLDDNGDLVNATLTMAVSILTRAAHSSWRLTMKLLVVLVSCLASASATAAMAFNITTIVTRTCTPTPTPQGMAGLSKNYTSASLKACEQLCVGLDCVGFMWTPPTTCMVFDWISTAFDTLDPVSSYRCRAQMPPENALTPGLDIAKVFAATADECSYVCEATVGCFAYSWTSASGGSCLLKSDKPSTFTGPYDGSVVSGEVYKCSKPDRDRVLFGKDLGSAPAALWGECCALCRHKSGCQGFSWTEDDGGTCWFKGDVTLDSWSPAPGAVSGWMLPFAAITGSHKCEETDTQLVFAGKTEYRFGQTVGDCIELCLRTNCSAFIFNQGQCILHDWVGRSFNGNAGRSWRCRRQLPIANGNYVGLTISYAPTTDPYRCSYKCDSTANCWAYSWTKANNGTCWLKSNKPAAISEPFDGSAISGESYKCTEPQFDRDAIGTDLASVQRPAWSDCCGECRRKSGCEAFSWSNYNGGTCWLKTKVTRSKTKYAPGTVSGYIYTSAAAKTQCTRVETQLAGNRIRTEPVTTFEECQQLCLFYDCVGFEFETEYDYVGGCWVFESITSAFISSFYPKRQHYRCRAQLTQENGDYVGQDLANVPSKNAALCSYTCEETKGCYAYSWSTYNGGVCYMKTSKPNTLSGPFDGSVISGESPKAASVWIDLEAVGRDIGSVQRDNYLECCGVCRRTAGCEAAAWTIYNGGTCWLKGNVTDLNDVIGVITVEF